MKNWQKFNFSNRNDRLETLLNLLLHDNEKVVEKSLKTLDRKYPEWRLSEESLIVVRKIIEGLERQLSRSCSIFALGLIGDVKAVPNLISLLKNNIDSVMKRDIIESLGLIKSEYAIDPIITLLNDKEEVIRKTSAIALGRIGSKKAVQPLLKALEDSKPSVRSFAAESLGYIGDVDTCKYLIPKLRDSDKSVRASSAKALGLIGDDSAVDALISCLQERTKKEPLTINNAIIEAFGLIGNAKPIELLLNIVKIYMIAPSASLALERIAQINKPFLSHYPYLFCKKCRHYAIKKGYRFDFLRNKPIVFCPKCYGVKHLLSGIKKVIGVIGNPEKTNNVDDNVLVYSLWDERKCEPLFADINELYISGDTFENLELLINSIIITISENTLKKKESMKEIPVKVVGNNQLSNFSINMLKDNFGEFQIS